MGILDYFLALYLCGVLGISGLQKLEDLGQFAHTLRQQQLFPQRSVVFLAATVPFLEIIFGFLLATGIAEYLTAILVVLIFLIFGAVKTHLFVTKIDADCGCHGAQEPVRVDTSSIAASVLLILVATTHFLLESHVSEVGWWWRLSCSSLFVLLTCYILGSFVARRFAKWRSVFVPPPDLPGLAVGQSAPEFVATDQNGTSIQLADTRGERVLLAFVAPGCPACDSMLTVLRAQNIARTSSVKVLLVGGLADERNRAYASEHELDLPCLTPQGDVAQRYKVRVFPTLFALDEGGVIRARGLVATSAHLYGLLHLAYQETKKDAVTPLYASELPVAAVGKE